MPRSSSRRRAGRPLWLIILIAVAGWLYGRYIASQQQPPQKQNIPKQSAPRTSRAPRQSPPRRQPAQPPSRPLPEYSPEAPSGRAPREIEGELQKDVVISVYDGDTVTLKKNGKVRLIGVDCPEKAQPGGREAGEFARNALLNKTIELEVCPKQPTDRYGRWLGFIYLQDRRGERVLFNAELVRQGYANVYSLRPCTVDEELWESYQAEARRARRGLFATLGEVPDAAAYRRLRR